MGLPVLFSQSPSTLQSAHSIQYGKHGHAHIGKYGQPHIGHAYGCQYQNQDFLLPGRRQYSVPQCPVSFGIFSWLWQSGRFIGHDDHVRRFNCRVSPGLPWRFRYPALARTGASLIPSPYKYQLTLRRFGLNELFHLIHLIPGQKSGMHLSVRPIWDATYSAVSLRSPVSMTIRFTPSAFSPLIQAAASSFTSSAISIYPRYWLSLATY